MKRRCLCLLLALSLSLLCACAGPEEAPAGEETPAPYALSSGSLVQKEELSSLLVMGMAYDSENASYASTLTLVLAEDGADGLCLLAIPRDTRVLVNTGSGDGQPRFGPISEAYYLGEAAGSGEEDTLALVGGLLGGVPLDNYAMLNIVQLRELNTLCGGVSLQVSEQLAAAYSNLSPGFQPLGRNLEVYASHNSMLDQDGQPIPGTDTQKMSRHQQLIAAFLTAMRDALDSADDPDALCEEMRAVLRTDLDAQAFAAFIRKAAALADKGVKMETLPGADEQVGQELYFLPDVSAAKDWVLSHFYEELP